MTDISAAGNSIEADIALLLEGTYPFIRGGVSTWVHQLINGFPQLRFALIFIGDRRQSYGEPRYPLPKNIVSLDCLYIAETPQLGAPKARRGYASTFDDIRSLHTFFRTPQTGMSSALMQRIANDLGHAAGLSYADFQWSELAWQQITDSYTKYSTEPSFLDYFWTVRSMHGPLFALAHRLESLPKAKVYHAVSTGYAGFLGALLHYRHTRPLILTEHGIYTKERKIDLSQVEWIRDAEGIWNTNLGDELSYLRRLWIRFFEGLGRLTYHAAEPIIAITEGNRERQLVDGAAPERLRVIPNGVSVARFAPLRALRPNPVPFVLGLIGRVVPIKDIATFIRAMRSICGKQPSAEGWIIGNEDEDPTYAEDCRQLVANLGLNERIRFLGFQDIVELLPKLGLMALTSISEGLPLVILEGFASGLPAVTTDVGACRELIEGSTQDDRRLGTAGAVVGIADPEAFAEAALTLLENPLRWRTAQQAAIARVEKLYTQEALFESYHAIYAEALAR